MNRAKARIDEGRSHRRAARICRKSCASAHRRQHHPHFGKNAAAWSACAFHHLAVMALARPRHDIMPARQLEAQKRAEAGLQALKSYYKNNVGAA